MSMRAEGGVISLAATCAMPDEVLILRICALHKSTEGCDSGQVVLHLKDRNVDSRILPMLHVVVCTIGCAVIDHERQPTKDP